MSQNGVLAPALDSARAAIGEPLVMLSDDEICARIADVERLGRLVDTLRVTTAADLDRRFHIDRGAENLGRRYGSRSAPELIQRLARVSGAEASRRVRIGDGVVPRSGLDGRPVPAEFPAVSHALYSGELGVDAAGTIMTTLKQAAPRASFEALRAAEESLVGTATHEPADLVALHARVWRAALDPDGAKPREEELRRQRSFRIGREKNGMTPFFGNADPETAAFLRGAIDERTTPRRQPRFVGAEDVGDGSGSGSETGTDADETGTDERTREQRGLDVLIGLVRAGVRAEAGTGALHPTATMNVTVTLAELSSGVGHAWFDDLGEPISAATAQRIACDAGLRLFVLGENGEPLWQGRRQRFFTPAQRRALALRDGGCVWNCTAPPSRSDAHHVIPVESGGHTDVDNGVLLCPFHHHLLHSSDYRIRMINGRPHLLAPPWIDPDQQWRPLGRSARVLVA